MRWGRIDLTASTLRVFQLKSTRYLHGCADPHACEEKWHKKPCATPCKRHKKRCPTPCRPDCRFHAQHCPERQGGKWEFRQPKGGKSRTVVISELLVRELKAQWRKQKKLKEMAGEDWTQMDLCFPNSLGKPLEPHDDWADWKWLCKAAGVRDPRLLSRSGARFRCSHRPVSPDRSPNPSCRSLGNRLSTVPAVRRGSWWARGLDPMTTPWFSVGDGDSAMPG